MRTLESIKSKLVEEHGTVEERVSRGVLLLDEKLPEWRTRIDLSKLNLSAHCECVMGQCFGSYWRGLNELGLYSGISHGFDIPAQDDVCVKSELYVELQAEWLKRLESFVTE